MACPPLLLHPPAAAVAGRPAAARLAFACPRPCPCPPLLAQFPHSRLPRTIPTIPTPGPRLRLRGSRGAPRAAAGPAPRTWPPPRAASSASASASASSDSNDSPPLGTLPPGRLLALALSLALALAFGATDYARILPRPFQARLLPAFGAAALLAGGVCAGAVPRLQELKARQKIREDGPASHHAKVSKLDRGGSEREKRERERESVCVEGVQRPRAVVAAVGCDSMPFGRGTCV